MTHRTRLATPAAIACTIAILLLLLLSPRAVRSQEPPLALPTPKGQLGGPPPIGQDQGLIPAPAASPEATRDIPAPSECQVEPRSIDDIQALIPTAAATPLASPTADTGTPTAGEPAPDDVAAGVAATAREFIACVNAGDYPRLFALMSDAYLPRFLKDSGLDSPDAINLLVGQPQAVDPADQTELIAVRDILVYPDGHVSAIITGDDPTTPGPARSPTFLLVQSSTGDNHDRWLVDDILSDPALGAATPNP